MKITPKGSDSVKVSRSKPSTESRGAPLPPVVSETAPVPETDSVELSAYVSGGQVPASEAPFDAEQVARIKEAMRNGEFSVNAGIVADKLLEIERALVRQQKK